LLKLILNVALPALGIVLAALVQLALTTLWSGIKVVPSLVVSIDSYFVVLLTVGLCFVAGDWAQRSVPTIAGAACAVIAPLAWWLRPLALFTIFTAMAPLIGVALGWAISFSSRRNVQEAV
jgi:hypothetical protein